jgi:hypothetical protein
MATETILVSVVLERRVAVSQWADHLWLPVAVLPGDPAIAHGTKLGSTDTGERFFAGSFHLDLHRTDTPTYRDNLASYAPRIWIAVRAGSGPAMPEIVGVTADPAEGEAYTEAGDDIVEHVPMAPEIAGLLAEFIQAHHVERVFIKRKRRDWSADEPDDQA